MPLDLVTVPCLSDNYAYLIHDPDSGATAVADVPDAGAVAAALAGRGWRLTDILLTHHHADHVGGVAELRAQTGARVWGAAADAHRLPPLDRAVGPERTERFDGATVRVFAVPGHTSGHIAYFLDGENLLLSGDSLMALGCGRLFEGTPEQMLASLTALAALPDDTTVCSGHEYAQTNARFALGIDPDNPALQDRAAHIDALRGEGRPTLPTRLGEEKATNPFLRAHDPAIRAKLGLAEAPDVDVFARIRALRDSFR